MPAYPFLRTYEAEKLRRISLPLGGIGTGTISLGGRGNLHDFEIMNAPAKGFTPTLPFLKNLGPFFALRTERAGEKKARLLEGPLDVAMNDPEGSREPNAGFPRFEKATFRTAYPLAEIELKDEAMPLAVTLQAMNPFVPGDAEASGFPVLHLRFVLRNEGSAPVRASVVGTMVNPIGVKGASPEMAWGSRKKWIGWKANRNRLVEKDGKRALLLDSEGVDPRSEAWGTLALLARDGEEAGGREAWEDLSWGDSALDFWDEFLETGRVAPRQGKGQFALLGSLASATVVPPGEEQCLSFLLAWHFPNRRSWTPGPSDPVAGVDSSHEDLVGNHYTRVFSDAMDAATKADEGWDELEGRTVRFVRSFVESPAPAAVKEAALFNVSTLRCPTSFRTADGNFFGWEGVHDEMGSCHGSCTHVWNYEQTTPFLFGSLARSMRRVEFLHATDDEGVMRFRTRLPLSRNQTDGDRFAAADGQMGAIVKLYREWILSGDRVFLAELWPKAKRALSFAWVEGGWDEDRDGVMEGCQHNTMDVEYYGPNPQMQLWYLAALKAAEAMALEIGEKDFAASVHELSAKGRAFTEKKLWNGEWFEQIVGKPGAKIHPTLRVGMGRVVDGEPQLQLGSACLIDQLVGQTLATLLGLGDLVDGDKVRATLRSILKHNRKESLREVMNPMRQYVLPDEAAVVMATWPKGGRPRRPMPYFAEVMTGFEHLLASHLIAEGMVEEGVAVTEDVRRRHDGERRSPFNEAECGHHYARAMAAWGSWLAWCGFRWNGVTGALDFADRPGVHVITWGDGWGLITVGAKVKIEVREGRLPVKMVRVGGKEVAFDLA